MSVQANLYAEQLDLDGVVCFIHPLIPLIVNDGIPEVDVVHSHPVKFGTGDMPTNMIPDGHITPSRFPRLGDDGMSALK